LGDILEDEDISLALAEAFGKQHMTVITGAQTERLEKSDGGIRLHYRKQGLAPLPQLWSDIKTDAAS